jgi:AAA ATPase domain
MLAVAHPEVLSPDWLPPVALDRAREVDAARRQVVNALAGGRPPGVVVVGPAGAGTSTVARLAARAALAEVRSAGERSRPLFAAVRATPARGAQRVATDLLRLLDDGFSGRGFRTAEILAGFLRRLRREGRPCVVVVDDVGPGTGDLAGLVRAFTVPDSFLPEGQSGMPPLALVLAGSTEARGLLAETERRGWPVGDRVRLAPYPPGTIERIVRDRTARALGRAPPEPWISRLVARVRDRPGNAVLALDLVRRSLLSPLTPRVESLATGNEMLTERIEPPLLAALARVAPRGQATVAELRQWEAEFAVREGGRPLPTTTFWRRIVRLESVGLVHREVRTGGAGGTRSVIELLRPLSGPPGREPPGTPPVGAWPPLAGPVGGPARAA